MEVGVLVRYGGVMPGKEKMAVDLFTEVTKIYGEKLADATFTYFEPFIFRTGDIHEELGFWVAKGPQEKVMAFFDSKEQKTLRTKSALIVNHIKIDYLYTGADVLEQVEILTNLAEEKVPALV